MKNKIREKEKALREKLIRRIVRSSYVALLCAMVFFVSACSEKEAVETLGSIMSESASVISSSLSSSSYTDPVQTEAVSQSTEAASEISAVPSETVSVSSDSEESTSVSVSSVSEEPEAEAVEYHFRNKKLLNQHYEKHGIDMGFDSPESYEAAASEVINDPLALHKTEADDGDDVYYIESTNEFVVLSTDGYIRTYFYPNSGKAYYDRQ